MDQISPCLGDYPLYGLFWLTPHVELDSLNSPKQHMIFKAMVFGILQIKGRGKCYL